MQSTCINYFFIDHMWVDCNMMTVSSPSPSGAFTSLKLICLSCSMLLRRGFLREGLQRT